MLNFSKAEKTVILFDLSSERGCPERSSVKPDARAARAASEEPDLDRGRPRDGVSSR
jgi:hypothetical protein